MKYYMNYCISNHYRFSSPLWLKSMRRTYSNDLSAKSFIEIGDEVSANKRKICYERTTGRGRTEVLYIPGFMSGMSGIKATALRSFCMKKDITYTRYDPSGLGSSRMLSLEKARLSHWIQDAESILNLQEKPLIIVASSMGAWIALKLYEKYPRKFESLVLLAPGINFTSRYFDKISQLLPKSTIEKLERGETVNFIHPEYGKFPISVALAEDLYKNEIDLSSGLDIQCPIRIIHGTLDEDVDYEESLQLMDQLKSSDVQVTFVKDAYHRLSTEKDLLLIFDSLSNLMKEK